MFRGFTDKTLDFLIAIRYNNNREFFHDNHDWYMESVRRPLLDLAFELSDTIESIDPELERRPERAVSRINRDLRFSKDKSPYRDWMWIGWHHPANKHGFPAFYMDISAEHVGYGLGFWEDNKPLIAAHKLFLTNHSQEFLKLMQPATKGMAVELRSYKRIALPEEVDPSLRDWYAMRSLYVFNNISDMKTMLSPDLAALLKREFIKLNPLARYCADLKPAEID